MVLPIIGVELPAGAEAPEVAALIEACDRAFLEGECRRAPSAEEGPAADLAASIEWLSSTEARVTIARPRDSASDSEEVTFLEQDAPLERYRALGFAIGSLGSAFVAEPKPPPEPPAPKETAPEPTPPRTFDPPDPITDHPVEPAPPLDPALTRVQLELGLLGGNGLEHPRLGGELALWVPVYGRWVSRVSGSLATQGRTTEGVGATFWDASVGFGPRWMAGDSLVAVIVGVQVEQLQLTLGEAELTRPTPAAGPFIGVHGRLLATRFAPFVALRAGALPVTSVALEALDSEGDVASETPLATHGPLQAEVLAGLSLAF